VRDEHHQEADVERDDPPEVLPVLEELRRVARDRERVPAVTLDRADSSNGDRHVRKNREQDQVELHVSPRRSAWSDRRTVSRPT
jgi:hypothetical protein